jgi:hypothetical protein
MNLPSLEIVQGGKKNGAGAGGRKPKGRRFAVRLLGYLAANSLWEWGRSDSVIRPVWIAFFGGEQESQAFFANFRAGRQAKTRSEQLLRRAVGQPGSDANSSGCGYRARFPTVVCLSLFRHFFAILMPGTEDRSECAIDHPFLGCVSP